MNGTFRAAVFKRLRMGTEVSARPSLCESVRQCRVHVRASAGCTCVCAHTWVICACAFRRCACTRL